MESQLHIKKRIAATIESTASIKEVKLSPFFKEKVMHQIRNVSPKEIPTSWLWLTPKVQLAILLVFIFLNIFTYFNLGAINNTNIDEFAISSGLVNNNDALIFN